MRFCHVTTFFPPQHFGGDAVFVASLANLLVQHGHHVEVVHCTDSFRLFFGVDAQPFPLDRRVVVHSLQSPAGPLSPLATYFTGKPWFKPLDRILSQSFDVIHWHNASLVGGPGAFHLGGAGAVRLCTLHEYWLICPVSTLYRYGRAPCDNPTCWRCSIRHLRPPQVWRSVGSTLRDGAARIDRYLSPSEYTAARYARSQLGIRPTVLPLFSPQAPPPPRDVEAAKAGDSGYFLFCGRLEPVKGLQTVLPVFLKSGHRLKIAGDGGLRPQLERMAGGRANIEFLGPRPYADLRRLYAGALATVVPSLVEETFGLVALESLQCGTPAIVRNRGALPEIIESSGGGWVFDDEAQLARIVDEVASAPEAARRRAAEARLALFSAEEHLRRYLEIVGEVRSARR